jgi:hypothetical protein
MQKKKKEREREIEVPHSRPFPAEERVPMEPLVLRRARMETIQLIKGRWK